MFHFEGVWSAGALPDHSYSKSLLSKNLFLWKKVSLMPSEVKQPIANDVWGGVDEHGICENSDELLQSFQKSAQHYPEP